MRLARFYCGLERGLPLFILAMCLAILASSLSYASYSTANDVGCWLINNTPDGTIEGDVVVDKYGFDMTVEDLEDAGPYGWWADSNTCLGDDNCFCNQPDWGSSHGGMYLTTADDAGFLPLGNSSKGVSGWYLKNWTDTATWTPHLWTFGGTGARESIGLVSYGYDNTHFDYTGTLVSDVTRFTGHQIPVMQWVMVTVNYYDNTSVCIWENDTLMACNAFGADMAYVEGSLTIGRADATTNYYEHWSGCYMKLRVKNTTFSQADITLLYNNRVPVDCEFTGDVEDTTPPSVDFSTINVTSLALGCVEWRTDQEANCTETDSTPTIKFTASESSNWCIWNASLNFSEMQAAGAPCTGSNTTEHELTLSAAGQFTTDGANDFYLSGIDESNNMNASGESSSGTLPIDYLELMHLEANTSVNGTLFSNIAIYVHFQYNWSIADNGTSNATYRWGTSLPSRYAPYAVIAIDKYNTSRKGDIETHITA